MVDLGGHRWWKGHHHGKAPLGSRPRGHEDGNVLDAPIAVTHAPEGVKDRWSLIFRVKTRWMVSELPVRTKPLARRTLPRG